MVDSPRLSAASRSATSEGTRPNVRVYHLRYAKAQEVAERIRQRFPLVGRLMSVGVDTRMNAILVSGDEKTLKFVERLLERLDVAQQEPATTAITPEGPEGSEGTPADKYKHLSIREVEQAIAKLLHDVTLAQDKAREARAAHQQAENDYKAATGEAKVAALLQALRLEIAAQREGLALGKVSKEFQAACKAYQNALDTEQIITADPGGEKKDDIPPSMSLSEERLPVLTVYHLKYGSAEEMAKELTLLFTGQENCRFAADSAQNALIVHGTQDQQEKVEQAIRSLDVPPKQGP